MHPLLIEPICLLIARPMPSRRTDGGGIKSLHQSVAEFDRNSILSAKDICYILLRLKRVINFPVCNVIELRSYLYFSICDLIVCRQNVVNFLFEPCRNGIYGGFGVPADRVERPNR